MNTIFEVKTKNNSETIEVEGTGQQTASVVMRKYRNKTIILKSFRNPTTNDFTPIKFN